MLKNIRKEHLFDFNLVGNKPILVYFWEVGGGGVILEEIKIHLTVIL